MEDCIGAGMLDNFRLKDAVGSNFSVQAVKVSIYCRARSERQH